MSQSAILRPAPYGMSCRLLWNVRWLGREKGCSHNAPVQIVKRPTFLSRRDISVAAGGGAHGGAHGGAGQAAVGAGAYIPWRRQGARPPRSGSGGGAV